MLKMNYSDLSKKNYNQIVKECERRGICSVSINEKHNYNDLIGKIIAHDAYYEGRDDALNGREKAIHSTSKNSTSEGNKRKTYIFYDYNNDSYYFKLTKDQVNLINCLIQNQIDLTNGEIAGVEEQDWMEP